MAESKTQGRRSAAAKSGNAGKSGKGGAKAVKAQAKSASKGAQTGSKASAKGATKSPGKATKARTKAPKPATRAAKPSASPGKPRKVTAKSAPSTPQAAAAPAKPQPRPPARRKVVEQTARRYFDSIAAREPASIASHWRDDGIYDSVPLGVFRGPTAVRRLYEEMFGAMPDMRLSVERITADDRVAAVQWRASGTFSGSPFRGIEATGRTVELRGVDCLEVEDGQIVRNTSVYDGAAAARGMGVLPPEDSGADRALRAGVNTVTKLRRIVAARGEGSQ
jgi:steroid delta-isomerase-like uncharacterized protein